ncbi:hypothetical protein DFH07DRAFT_705298, partial [Mycena maculata]
SKFAWVEKHVSKLPTLHKGELTPLIIDEFDLTITNYMTSKDIAADKQVAMILGCFMDPHFTNWFRPNTERKRLIALTLPDFLEEVKEKFLDDDGETQVRTDILSMRQTTDQSFDEFATSLIGHTSLLADTAPIPDTQIRLHLEAGMSDDLRFVCLRNTELRTLKVLVTIQIADLVTLKRSRESQEGFYATKVKHQNSKASLSASQKPPSSSSENPFPPRLSDTERDLLHEHDGCNRCRIPYVGHRSDKCTE